MRDDRPKFRFLPEVKKFVDSPPDVVVSTAGAVSGRKSCVVENRSSSPQGVTVDLFRGEIVKVVPVPKGEGDVCGVDGCTGILEYGRVMNCSCHVIHPCGACVNNPLTCSVCGEEVEPRG